MFQLFHYSNSSWIQLLLAIYLNLFLDHLIIYSFILALALLGYPIQSFIHLSYLYTKLLVICFNCLAISLPLSVFLTIYYLLLASIFNSYFSHLSYSKMFHYF